MVFIGSPCTHQRFNFLLILMGVHAHIYCYCQYKLNFYLIQMMLNMMNLGKRIYTFIFIPSDSYRNWYVFYFILDYNRQILIYKSASTITFVCLCYSKSTWPSLSSMIKHSILKMRFQLYHSQYSSQYQPLYVDRNE